MREHCPYCGLGLDELEALLRQELSAYPALVERILRVLSDRFRP